MADLQASPVWDEIALPSFAPPTRDVAVDVAVIGAGITGITTAFLLKRAGCRVALLDRRTVGGTDTGCTTAHLTAVIDTDLPSLVRSFGRDHAQAVWDAGHAAIHAIETLVTEENIACDFTRVPGYRHVPFDVMGDDADAALAALREEASLARELGFDVELVASTPLVARPGWRIDHQALFHPRKYLQALLERIPGHGSHIFEQCDVSLTDDPEVLSCGAHTVRAPYLVVATHNPLAGRLSAASLATLQTQLALYTTYALAATMPARPEIARAAYWDTSAPYRYVRTELVGNDVRVIAGGEDHKTGQAADTRQPFAALERWFSALAPDATVTHRWSGQVIDTVDGLPFIGEVAARQYLATGFGGNGMTFGTLAALIARDGIAGTAVNPWRELFDAGRSAVARGPLDYLRENADYPYYLIRDRFAGVATRTLRAVPRGEGRLVEVDGQVVAASRDEQGRVTTLSPACTHMGCRVQWNHAEHTWDCPCHGSRFTPAGEVLAGPAQSPLPPATVAVSGSTTRVS